MTSKDPALGQSINRESRRGRASKQKILSYEALRRARTTIEDFTKLYFPLHGLRYPEDFFKFLDVIVFVETAIYEMDEENEELSSSGCTSLSVTLEGESVLTDTLTKLGFLNSNIRLQLIQNHLEDFYKHLRSTRVSWQETVQGKLYWQRERMLCSQMAAMPCSHEKRFSLEDVHAASEGKSFDYRVLNYLLYSIRREEPDRDLMHFLFLDEHLVDIGDDLHDYEDDVLQNSFNIFRAYVHLYGEEAEHKLVARISNFEHRHHRAFQKLPAWMQAVYQKHRREASAVPGSEKWVIPRPILDEQAFRQLHQSPETDELHFQS